MALAPSISSAAQVDSPVTASSSFDQTVLPEYAVDDNGKTRWASRSGEDGEWLQLDLGKTLKIPVLWIRWEAAYAAVYEIQTSVQGTDWTTIYHQSNGKGGEERLADLKGKGRFLRILCHRAGPFSVYSIWEISSPDPGLAEALSDIPKRIKAARRENERAAREKTLQELKKTGTESIVFAARGLYPDGHWYANISYFARDNQEKTYTAGGGLYRFDLATGKAVPLIEDDDGTVRDPVVHYDGHTILFSWRPGDAESFHLYTIGADGQGLTQLTFGEYDDIEPAWLPDGGIVFVSSRCRRWVNCWLTQVAVLHRCDADGSNIIPLSANLEQDNTPWPMPDGRILYTRWEYVDRSQVDYHHLWTMNPDGAAQSVHFGNMHPGGLYIDAKPVPDSEDVLFINSPGHGQREHMGQIALVNVKRGPDELSSIRNLTGNGYRDPFPLSKSAFLAAKEKSIVLLNPDGVTNTLYSLAGESNTLEIHEPRPLLPHPKEQIMPRRVDTRKDTGRMILADVRRGRNMDGIAPGEIKKLLVIESLPKPINYTGGMDPLTYGGSFSLERIWGEIPVEDDGSAYLELPANRAFFFVALDENHDSVKRMQSFTSVMPGETLSCAGCHEPRSATGMNRISPQLKALSRGPSMIEPIPGIPEVFDFPRDIQPILDKHCVPCHDYVAHDGAEAGPRAGGVILAGDHGPMFSHSYASLTVHRQFVDGRDAPVSNLPPRSIGSSASPLMRKIREKHHGVSLSARETDWIRYWIETGSTYPGTYAALGSGSIGGYYANEPIETGMDWPQTAPAASAVEARCAACHQNERSLPKSLSDENGLSFWRPEWNDARLKRSRHLLFNLTRPAYSLILLAPLAREAGGFALCLGTDDKGNAAPIFRDTTDPDYQKLFDLCVAGKERLETIKRFDMPGFRPPYPYYREMKRYQILPAYGNPGEPFDPYTVDKNYWDSFTFSALMRNPIYGAGKDNP